MICEIRWPKPHEHCTWCDRDLNAELRTQAMVDGRNWVYCGLPCLLATNKAVIDTEEMDRVSN